MLSIIKIEHFYLLLMIFFLSGAVISKTISRTLEVSHSNSINGLRGFLGYSVFVSHFLAWHNYLNTGIWTTTSLVESNLGGISVALFFMISGYMFTGKVLDPRTNWFDLYIGRILRLTPLWLFLIFCAFVIFYINGGSKVFTVSVSDKNIPVGYHAITSGVTWTLWYEWLWLLLLPLISLIIRPERPRVIHLCAIILIITILENHVIDFMYLAYFMSGFIVFVAINKYTINGHMKYRVQIFLIILLIAAYSYKFDSQITKILLLTLIFYLIASGGGDCFGLLSSQTANQLGDFGYSLYLLQGPFIFMVISLVGFTSFSTKSLGEIFLIVAIVTPVYIFVCKTAYIYIERRIWNKKNISNIKSYIDKYIANFLNKLGRLKNK